MGTSINGVPVGGGGGSLPATPAAALLDASAPSTIVTLDGSGVGTASTPAATRALLDLQSSPTLTEIGRAHV